MVYSTCDCAYGRACPSGLIQCDASQKPGVVELWVNGDLKYPNVAAGDPPTRRTLYTWPDASAYNLNNEFGKYYDADHSCVDMRDEEKGYGTVPGTPMPAYVQHGMYRDRYLRTTETAYHSDLVAAAGTDCSSVVRAEFPDECGRNRGTLTYGKPLGTTREDKGQAVAIDSEGAVITGGWTEGTLAGATNQGGRDAFIMKLNPADGTQAWTVPIQFGTSDWDEVRGLATDSGNNIVAVGLLAYDGFIAKYSPSGTFLWRTLISSADVPSPSIEGVATDAAGNAYVVGDSYAQAGQSIGGQPSSGSRDAFIAKFDSSGNRLWLRLIGSGGLEYGSAVAVDSAGNAYIGGQTGSSIAGATTWSGGSGPPAFVAKFKPDGTRDWVTQFSRLNGRASGTYALSIDPSGTNIYAAGFSADINAVYHDAALAKLSLSGAVEWVRTFGGEGQDKATGVFADRYGRIHVSGRANADINGYTDDPSNNYAFLVDYASDGTQVFTKVKAMGLYADDEPSGAAFDPIEGSLYVACGTDVALTGTRIGGMDACLLKYQ